MEQGGLELSRLVATIALLVLIVVLIFAGASIIPQRDPRSIAYAGIETTFLS
jgi:hypothetical protein